MEKVLLHTSNQKNWGKKLNLPFAGETAVDEQGVMLVEQNVAELLIKNGKGFSLKQADLMEDAPELLGSERNDEEEKEQEANDVAQADSQPAPTEANEQEEIDLEQFSLAELKQVAIDAGFNPEDFKKFSKSKKLMIHFIKNNVK